jgi:hypothetical protein
LTVFCFFFPRDERPPAWAPRTRAPHLYFGAAEAQLDALGLGVGKQVFQGADAQARVVGDGEAASGEQGPHLADGTGDGGAIYCVQLGQGLMRQPQTQADQRDQ